jgi:hypothetical protein
MWKSTVHEVLDTKEPVPLVEAISIGHPCIRRARELCVFSLQSMFADLITSRLSKVPISGRVAFYGEDFRAIAARMLKVLSLYIFT